MTGELTTREANALQSCEETIERGLATFYDVGRALLQIRDQRLYRDSHASFEAYCNQRWDFDQSYGHRMANSAKVVEVLQHSPIGKSHPPVCESQVRALTTLEPAEIPDVWREVVDRAGGQRITARLVGEVVRWWRAPGDEYPEAEASCRLDGETHVIGNHCVESDKMASSGDDTEEDDDGEDESEEAGYERVGCETDADDSEDQEQPPKRPSEPWSLLAEVRRLISDWLTQEGTTREKAIGYLKFAANELEG